MYILVNNKPVDIFNLVGVTGIMTLDHAYIKQLVKNNDGYDLKSIDEELAKKYGVVDENDYLFCKYTDPLPELDAENPIYGYIFALRVTSTYQKYVNNSYNGIGHYIKLVYSSVYKNQLDAEAALNRLLNLINEQRSGVPSIEI